MVYLDRAGQGLDSGRRPDTAGPDHAEPKARLPAAQPARQSSPSPFAAGLSACPSAGELDIKMLRSSAWKTALNRRPWANGSGISSWPSSPSSLSGGCYGSTSFEANPDWPWCAPERSPRGPVKRARSRFVPLAHCRAIADWPAGAHYRLFELRHATRIDERQPGFSSRVRCRPRHSAAQAPRRSTG